MVLAYETPGSIQDQLHDHPDIKQVIVQEYDGSQVAFVHCEVPMKVSYLREVLQSADLVPDELYVVLDDTNLAQLRKDKLRSRADYVTPTSPTEEYLCALWGDLLNVDRVGVEDDFFRLGGYSMLAVLARRAIERDRGILLPAEVIFMNGKLRDLANIIDDSAAAQ